MIGQDRTELPPPHMPHRFTLWPYNPRFPRFPILPTSQTLFSAGCTLSQQSLNIWSQFSIVSNLDVSGDVTVTGGHSFSQVFFVTIYTW